MSQFSRRRFIKTAVAGGSVMALGGLSKIACSKTGRSHPNLIIVYPDQMRGQAMGFLNEDPVITPNLDRFARESLVLPQAVCNYPVCSPSRAMLWSGKYPHSNNVLGNCNTNGAKHGYEMRQSEQCLSDILCESGYSLGYIGKWHLDSPYKPYVKSSNNSENFAWNEWCSPERRHGFDFWYAYGTYDQHLNPMYWATDSPREKPIWIDQWGPEHEADMAIKYIRNENGDYRDQRKPFALVVAMNPPHMPYNLVPEKYIDKYSDKTYRDLVVRTNVDIDGDSRMSRLARNQTKNYFAMITGVDDQFGRILDVVNKQGLDEDTIVLFTSDHGNCIGSHNEVSKNNHYEESMRIPFMIRWPGKIKSRLDDLLLSTPDIFPTMLDLMGCSDSIPENVEGVDYAGLFLTGEGQRPTSQLYFWTPYGQPEWGRRGVRTDQYTLMISKMPDMEIEHVLHDNINDPYQLKNFADENPDIVKFLVENELNPWLRKTNDP
jgi:arylsulfatase A-like enzyme